MPLVRLLADNYPKRNDVKFTYLPGLHSGAGIKGAASGELDVGATSRSLDATESRLGLREAVLSTDGLAIAVHQSVTIPNLTTEQVRGVYRGDYSNWKELGGPDLPIVILDRNEDESAKMVLRKYVLGKTHVSSDAVIMFFETDMVEALRTTEGAIGYFSLGYAISQDVPVRLMDLDGVSPSVRNIIKGRYRVVRPLSVVTGSGATEAATEFVDWAHGPEAARILNEKGYAAASAASSQ